MPITGSANSLGRAARFTLELLLGLFVLGLFVIVWLPSESVNGSTSLPAVSNLLPQQGTNVVTGSISPTDSTFTGQRHFRSNIVSDKNCVLFGQNGPRFYDQAFFFNGASTPQRVTISFTTTCGTNTFMAAYTPQFNPNDLCANFIASSGVSGNVTWSFLICANTQFSIIVYGLEPLVTCDSYAYSVSSPSGIIILGQSSGKSGSPGPPDVAGKFPPSDVTIEKVTPDDTVDSDVRYIPPDSLKVPPPQIPAAPPLAATISGSINGSEPRFVGLRHFRSGLRGDTNCSLSGAFSSRAYDEAFFFNSSSISQKVSIVFTSGCGTNTYMAAYTPQFISNSICSNYIAGAGVAGNVTWEFTVCPNSVFSIVVYAVESFLLCPAYSYQVFAEGVMSVGTPSDVSITKSAPLGSVQAGENLPYTIIIRNNGPAPASGITFTDVLPPSTAFSSLSLISGFGSPLPTSTCTTPPVGSNGTVTCSNLSLSGPSSGPESFLAVLLSVNVSPRSSSIIFNTATVSHPGFDSDPSNNSATVTTTVTGIFNLCLQDDGDPAKVLFINSLTGDYRFCCRGITATGRGKITVRGNTYTLEDNSLGRRLLARDDEGTHSGNATLEMPRGTVTCSITDRNTLNNTCACR